MKIEIGNVIELRNGDKLIYHQSEEAFSLDGKLTCHDVLSAFNENYEMINSSRDYDIIRIYSDYTLTTVLWERKEFVVSTDEKTILRILPKQFKWIVRTENNELFLYEDKPQKTRYYWESSKGDVENLMVFNHLFEYIKWEDESPTLIENLLKN